MTESANLRSRLSLGPRRKAREFALLGVYESLINESADFAAIDANLLSVITDEGSPVAGCDLSSEDFDHCDQEFYRDILDGVIKGKGELLETLSRHLDRDPATFVCGGARLSDDRYVGNEELPADSLSRRD